MILTNVEPKRKEKKNLNKMDVIALAVNMLLEQMT
jgi:hypothetical protein